MATARADQKERRRLLWLSGGGTGAGTHTAVAEWVTDCLRKLPPPFSVLTRAFITLRELLDAFIYRYNDATADCGICARSARNIEVSQNWNIGT